MRKPTVHDIRVLSVDLYSRGFGYAVFEGPDFLVDWGIASIREKKAKQTLARIESMIGIYRPHVFVTEDLEEKSSRRCKRIRKLSADVCQFASREGLSVHPVTKAEVRQAFAEVTQQTKRGYAVAASNLFPELRPLMPPVRKPWMSEDERINIFDAVTFGYAYFSKL